MDHIAIVTPHCLDAILDGRKTVESRLSRNRRAPFRAVGVGDCVWFKERGGGIGASARVARVLFAEGLSPSGVARLRRDFGAAIVAEPGYWQGKRLARYATLIWLDEVRATERGPRLIRTPGDRSAWFTLQGAEQPAAKALA
ncbi:MAG: hypothetical protein ACKVW3_00185 [Phycisphaerales bacterium]